MKNLVWMVFALPLLGADGCDNPTAQQPATSDSGIKKASVKVAVDPEGYSIEQRNVMARLDRDNKPGSIKHLYVISAMSGQVLLYSTVKGKVTSSGKRLTPNSVQGYASSNGFYRPMEVAINGQGYWTGEVLQDDGTYGSSVDYLFWFDVRGVYHQFYPTGGAILHISDQPIAVKDIVINLETTNR